MSYRLLAIPQQPAVSISSLPAFALRSQTLVDVIRQPRASHSSAAFSFLVQERCRRFHFSRLSDVAARFTTPVDA